MAGGARRRREGSPCMAFGSVVGSHLPWYRKRIHTVLEIYGELDVEYMRFAGRHQNCEAQCEGGGESRHCGTKRCHVSRSRPWGFHRTATLAFPSAATQIIPTTALDSFTANSHHSYPVFTMAALATKTQSQNIFNKLKSKPANKVGILQ